MEVKMFCEIMNRIRRNTKAAGYEKEDVSVRVDLINGDTILFNLANYGLLDDYIEASDDEKIYFIPIKNIVSIEI